LCINGVKPISSNEYYNIKRYNITLRQMYLSKVFDINITVCSTLLPWMLQCVTNIHQSHQYWKDINLC